MVISLAQMPLTCVKFWPLQVIKGDNFADWLWGCPQALIQQRQVSSVHIGLANGTKHFHKTGGIYYQSCMYPTNSAWPAFLMPFLILLPVSGLLSRGFTGSPTKACQLSATPAGTYWLQSPGFPKLVYRQAKGWNQNLVFPPPPSTPNQMSAACVEVKLVLPDTPEHADN